MSSFEEDFEPYRASDAHDEMDARFGWGLRNNEVHHLRKQVEELAAAFTAVWITADRGGWDAKAVEHFDALVELHNVEVTGLARPFAQGPCEPQGYTSADSFEK